MTTSIISGTKMSSFITCLLFFVSVGIVRTQDFQFPSDDNYNTYPTFGNYGSDAYSADAISNVDDFGNSNAKSNANTWGNNGWANSYSDAESSNPYPYGGSARAGSNSGTRNRYGNSGSEARADSYVDQFGNIRANAESYAQSGPGGSNAASASATAGINKFGEPVGAVATGTASAGSGGHSHAISLATVTGGNNRPRNQGQNNYPQSFMPYPYHNNRPFFGYRSGVDDADNANNADDDSKA
ncbi:uncharacterized protein LOC141534815 [Cotesia typhae]|uniref:uncharacterized protein LOC141534815 n=1 Tax=Cotesia typhae TaxID=2053667 RepID=UPI003D69E17D